MDCSETAHLAVCSQHGRFRRQPFGIAWVLNTNRCKYCSPSPDGSPPPTPTPDCRSALLGLYLAPGKTTIYGPSLADHTTRPTVEGILSDVVNALGDPSLPPPLRLRHMLRGDGTTALSGHRVLGTPIGTPAFISAFTSDAISSALRFIPILDRLLLDSRELDDPSVGLYAPDERAFLLRSCIHPRVRHLLHTVRPGFIDTELSTLHSSVLDAYLAPILPPDPSDPQLIDFHRLISQPLRLGGHGLTPSVASIPGRASYHDVSYYGSFSRVWYYICTWVPFLASVASLDPSRDHRDAIDPSFRSSLISTYDRIAACCTVTATHPYRTALPPQPPSPHLYHQLLDGPIIAPIQHLGTPPPDDEPTSSAVSSRVIFPLDSFSLRALPLAQRAASDALADTEFIDLYSSSTPAGRARLLDGSTPSGPAAWLQRVPSSARFRFHLPVDYVTALSLDILLCPPHLRTSPHCSHCSMAGRHSLHGPYGRHFVQCPHGIRLHTTVHDPTRDALAELLGAALGPSRVVSEWSGSHTSMRAWMSTHGGGLEKQPDIVLIGLDGVHSFTLIDLKVTDVAGPSAISALRTPTIRFASHSLLVRRGAIQQFGLPDGKPPPHSRMRLVTFVVSTFGSIGVEAQRLLGAVALASGSSVPACLYDETSWASAAFVSFARQAITLSARRELARGLRYSFSDAQAQRCYRPAVPPASPTPDLGPTAFDAPDGEDPA